MLSHYTCETIGTGATPETARKPAIWEYQRPTTALDSISHWFITVDADAALTSQLDADARFTPVSVANRPDLNQKIRRVIIAQRLKTEDDPPDLAARLADDKNPAFGGF